MKKLIGVGVILLIAAGFLVYYFFFRADTLLTSIEKFENGNYKSAVIILNKLLLSAGFDEAEKIYYYRCKSLTRLAETIERRYDDELKAASKSNTDVEDREDSIREINSVLKEINEELKSDLILLADNNAPRIVSRGLFYSQFLERYQGSRYIEDIDFEEVDKAARIDRGNFLRAVASFYGKYPNTTYISQLVPMLFDCLKAGGVGIAGNDELLKKMIVHFGRKYPTSSEFQRIFTCNGEKVNLRNSPGVNGKVVGKVELGKILIQLEKSMDSVQIGESRNYWYRVSDLNGLQGWIFGKFLNSFDVSLYTEAASEERWTLDERFQQWIDSNTPVKWIHPEGSSKSAISFYEKAGMKIVKLSAAHGQRSGLFRRMTSPYSFVISAKGRFIQGNGFILFGYVLSDNNSGYYIKLKNMEVDINGRRIPYQTSLWHEYRLESSDGKFAKIYIDGELISGRIPVVTIGEFSGRGLYCLYSSAAEESAGELEYLKVR
jgi:hypothetical protein